MMGLEAKAGLGLGRAHDAGGRLAVVHGTGHARGGACRRACRACRRWRRRAAQTEPGGACGGPPCAARGRRGGLVPAILPFISVTARVASSAEEKATNAEPRLLGKGERSGRGRQQSGTLKEKKRPRKDVRANSAIISANVASRCSARGRRRRGEAPPCSRRSHRSGIFPFEFVSYLAPEASRMTRQLVMVPNSAKSSRSLASSTVSSRFLM